MNRKQTKVLVLGAALAFWPLCSAVLLAQEKEEKAEDEEAKTLENLVDDYEAVVRGRALWLSDRKHAGKFLEYRDVPRYGSVDRLEFGNRKRSTDEYYFRIKGKDVGQKDEHVDFEAGHYGTFDLDVTWDRLPHRFGTGGSTLYRGLGSGRLTINDQIQTDLQATSAANQSSQLLRYLDQSQDLGIDNAMLQSDRVGALLEWYQFDPVRLTVDVDLERRDGIRPMGASFGHGRDTVELLEPIDYWTFNTRGAVSYAQGPFDAEAFYRFGFFHTGEESLTFDNPLRITDTVGIAGTGRVSLYSDNTTQEFGLKAGYNITKEMRLAGNANWAIDQSDVEVLPYTSNLAFVRGAGTGPLSNRAPYDLYNAANLPDRNFDGQVLTQSYDLSLAGHVVDPVEYKLYGRYFVKNDLREQMTFPGRIRLDAQWDTLPVRWKNDHYDYSKGQGGLETTFHLPWILSRLKPAYELTLVRRQNRAADRTIENAVKLDLETDWNQYIATDVGAGFSSRDARRWEELTDRPPTNLRWMRRYDEASRNRYDFHVNTSLTPVSWFSSNLGYRFQHDDFDARFGVNDMEWQEISVEGTVHANPDVDINIFYVHDRYDTFQEAREWRAGAGPFFFTDPDSALGSLKDSNSNWTALTKERVHTIGLSPTWRFLPQWGVTGSYGFSWNETRIDLASTNSGRLVDDYNPYEPTDLRKADDSLRHSLNLELDYEQNEWVEFYAGYGYDFFTSRQDTYRRATNVTMTNNGTYAGSYLLNLGYEDAQVHLAYLGLGIKF
ncbi:MAG: MtrB/PioB family outer membrane beta-barrel protein [Planctomycetes bacterium]|nr:MtrB/PioB family outer membrane beta-barrel protein [Planctomycetota bacterium]